MFTRSQSLRAAPLTRFGARLQRRRWPALLSLACREWHRSGLIGVRARDARERHLREHRGGHRP
ncbi:MAG TPA: hypothetical protein VL977_05555 [Solirubrobacteraceae bacterium]|nr:hypothetical protein [Solirubrobacteraceae bacterium]